MGGCLETVGDRIGRPAHVAPHDHNQANRAALSGHADFRGVPAATGSHSFNASAFIRRGALGLAIGRLQVGVPRLATIILPGWV